MLLERLVELAAHASFGPAAHMAKLLLETDISDVQLGELVGEIGRELEHAEREQAEAYRQRNLAAPPKSAQPPIDLAAVFIDGGRLQERAVGPEVGVGVKAPAWRESKVAVFQRMTGDVPESDPHPAVPRCFQVERDEADDPRSRHANEASNASDSWPPEPLLKTSLASLDDSQTFGWQMAAEAERRGFFSARRRVFLADGLAYNWKIQRVHFGSFTPILDIVHAVEHLHQAAKLAERPDRLEAWIEACWQGRIGHVIAELSEHLAALGPVPPEAEKDHPVLALTRERDYFRNNETRMDYPRYRCAGLPISSAPVESHIKQLNQRVKGSDRFWGRNAEAILRLRSAALSEDERLKAHLRDRPGHPWTRQPPLQSLAA
jgi:hypothetical protein